MADGRHFGKKVLSPYIRSCLTAFNEIWYGDAYWHAGDRQLKFRIFENRHKYEIVCPIWTKFDPLTQM